MLSTGISDSSDATFLTADSSENATFAGNLTVSGNLTVTGTTTQVDTVTMNAQNAVLFEGATADSHETTLTTVDPTGDRTISLPNVSGTLPVLAAASATAITSTPAELNIMDGGTSASSITIVDADRFVLNDNGTMLQVAASAVKTYIGSSPITALNNATENELVTVGSTTTELDAEANLTYDGSTLLMSSATSGYPRLEIKNTNADGQAPQLIMRKDGGSAADDDDVARIYFYTDDDAGNALEAFLAICSLTDASNSSEDTRLRLLTYEGGSQKDSLTLQGGSVGISGMLTPLSNHSKANKLVVGDGNAGGIAMYSGTNEGWYAFSRANAANTDAYDGGMSYNGDRDLTFHTNAGSQRMLIDGNGIVHIPSEASNRDTGENNAYSWLRVKGNTYALTGAGRMALTTGYKAYQLGANDGIGEIWFSDDTGGDWAYIGCQAGAQGGGTSGSPNDADDYPGDLVFGTTKDGEGSPTQRYRMYHSGKHEFMGVHQGDTIGHFIFSNQTGGDGTTTNCTLMVRNGSCQVQIMPWSSLGARIGTRGGGWNANGTQSVHLTANDTANIILTSGGSPTLGNGTAISSDRRLKENIIDIGDNQLDKINLLRPRTFTWKDTRKSGHQEGFIAQEVEEVIPEAVEDRTFSPDPADTSRDFDGDIKVLKHEVINARLVKAVQELSQKVADKDGIISALEQRIHTIEQRLI